MFSAHQDPEGHIFITFDDHRVDPLATITSATDLCNTLNWARDQQSNLRKQANDISLIMGTFSS